jgi:sarcosine oxidase, subunit gamma
MMSMERASMSRVAERRVVDLAETSGVARLLAPAAYYVLRGDAAVMQAASPVIGARPSETACRAVSGPVWSALWLGPDEQMLRGALEDQARFEAALSQALEAKPHSLVDVSHRQVALEVVGKRAATWINTACPLDLDLDAFPVSMVTRTVFAKAEVILWRKAPDVFHIDVWRSYANYLTAFLHRAAQTG